MQSGREYKTSWARVSEPAQRLVAEYGEFDTDATAPLQLNIYGSGGYVEKVVSLLKTQKLPILTFTRRRKVHEVTPVTGLIAMSDFSQTREGTDAMFFGRSPVAGLLEYSQALSSLVESSNRALLLQQLDTLPPPPILGKKPNPDLTEEADSA